MKTLRKQRGISMLGWLAIIVMVGIIGTGAMQFTPVYLEYYSIVNILENLQNDPEAKGKTKRELEFIFVKRLSVNNIKYIKPENYKISKVQGRNAYLIELHYNISKPLFGNLSLVADFQCSGEVNI